MNKAFYWYLCSAEKGDKPAQYQVACFYYEGKGVTQDIEQAVFWYKKAAEQGHYIAQMILGMSYLRGVGVEKNIEEGMKWCKKAANQGNDIYQYTLGDLYVDIKDDYSEAIVWYKKAANQGNVDAQIRLADCYYEGKGISEDSAEAVKWYKKAAEKKNLYAYRKLGKCYYLGKGVKKDYFKAAFYLIEGQEVKEIKTKEDVIKNSEERVILEAEIKVCFFAIRSYGNGYWEKLEKNAEQGSANMQYWIGKDYWDRSCNTRGVFISESETHNLKKAMYYLLKAKEQKHVDALKLYDKILQDKRAIKIFKKNGFEFI